ncbi:MAG TPA: hypothetical protein VHD56_15445 [Tepidisphaeraceae bacterium]|nr:hypothetical protein [Tepidisphaeraceae bacterium]
MKRLALLMLALAASGCARPWEIGWDPAYSLDERNRQIARNWDFEGKQIVEDVDHILLLRPAETLSIWNIR